ncbi:MAG: DUF2007 domain-containing protein [Bacteroidales bacterium]|nr:DUF2007 domain-containing protein [Bacteroidales bacterium]
MENDWVLIYSAGNIQEAELIKGMLLEQGIESNIMNKQDSAYLLGDVELYVMTKDEITAKKLVDEHYQPQ